MVKLKALAALRPGGDNELNAVDPLQRDFDKFYATGTVAVQGGEVAALVVGTMRGISDASRIIADSIGEISAASGEQSTGVSEVSQAVKHMDQATQENAALVESMAAAATPRLPQGTTMRLQDKSRKA